MLRLDGGIYQRNRVQLRHTPEKFNEPMHVENPDIHIEHEISDDGHKKDQEPKTAPTAPDSCLETDPNSFPGPDLGETTETAKKQPEFSSNQRPSRGACKPAQYRDPDTVNSIHIAGYSVNSLEYMCH